MRHDPDWLVEAMDDPSSDHMAHAASFIRLLIPIDGDAANGCERGGGYLFGDPIDSAVVQLDS